VFGNYRWIYPVFSLAYWNHCRNCRDVHWKTTAISGTHKAFF